MSDVGTNTFIRPAIHFPDVCHVSRLNKVAHTFFSLATLSSSCGILMHFKAIWVMTNFCIFHVYSFILRFGFGGRLQVLRKLCPQTQLPRHRYSVCITAGRIYLYKSYLWQYHSPWHREHLFAASLPQHPHFGLSGSKLSITSRLYVWANLVNKPNLSQ